MMASHDLFLMNGRASLPMLNAVLASVASHGVLLWALSGDGGDTLAVDTPSERLNIHLISEQRQAKERPDIQQRRPKARTELHATTVPRASLQPRVEKPIVRSTVPLTPADRSPPVVETAAMTSPIEVASAAMAIDNASAAREITAPSIIPLYTPQPHYPFHARKLGLEGSVMLHVAVSPQGNTGEIRVSKSSGYEILDEAAIDAVHDWRFKVNGIALVSWVDVPVRFELE